jgi:thiamine-phosphate pyrophosphorylase
VKSLADALLYGIVDLGYVAANEVSLVGERMIAGGVDVLQLRAKAASEHEIATCARVLVAMTAPANVPLIINDHPQLVPSIGAQGAHVGQDDLPIADARRQASRPGTAKSLPLIGKSTHSLDQAVAAEQEGADYIGFGPLFATPTKPGRAAIGFLDIRAVHEMVRLPIFCIGGITRENLERVLDAGGRRVVIVSAILRAPDIAAYCRDVKARLAEIADCAS